MSYAPKRKAISKKTRALVFERDKGICYLCGEKIGADEEWDCDHELARELGGADDISNYRPAHKVCHRSKTKLDVKLIAKGNRLIRNANPETRRKTRHPIPKPKNFKWPIRKFGR